MTLKLGSWLPGGRLLLERHRAQLAQTLQELAQRLCDAVAQTIGTTVADLVREIVRVVVADPRAAPSRRPPPDTLWGQEDEESWRWSPSRDRDEDEDPLWQDDMEDIESVAATRPDRIDDHRPGTRWSQAVAAGCATAAWWLRRWSGRCPLVTTLGVGTAVALLVYVAGPTVAALGSSLVGVACGLVGLTALVP